MSEKIVAQQIGHIINRQKENAHKRNVQSRHFYTYACTMYNVESRAVYGILLTIVAVTTLYISRIIQNEQ